MKPEDVIMCFLVLLLIVIVVGMPLWCIMQEHIKNKAKKNQHLMFNQLEKGDCVWCLNGESLKGYVISYVGYHFHHRTNEVDEINIHLRDSYHTLSIKIEAARAFVFTDWDGTWYTLHEDAKTRQEITKLERKRSIDKAKVVDADDFQYKLNKEIESLKKVGEDAIKKLEVKLD